MFNHELRQILIQVISSWQVLAVTIVLIIYIFIVNRVASLYRRRPRPPKMPKIKKIKPEKTDEKAAPGAKSDDLELDEEE